MPSVGITFPFASVACKAKSPVPVILQTILMSLLAGGGTWPKIRAQKLPLVVSRPVSWMRWNVAGGLHRGLPRLPKYTLGEGVRVATVDAESHAQLRTSARPNRVARVATDHIHRTSGSRCNRASSGHEFALPICFPRWALESPPTTRTTGVGSS